MSTGTSTDRRWSALALIVTAQFMVILDVAIVNVALPSIKADLHFSETNLQWVITAYAILFGGALLLGGRLADLLGRRRLFVTGLALFSAASLLCGLAWSEGSLIAFRGVQGLGGALLAPAAPALLMPAFALGGAGMGFSFVPVTIASLTGVQRADAGVASGLVNTSRQIGGAIGVAATSAIAATSTSHYLHSHSALTASNGVALDHGFQTALYALTGVLVVGALIAATLVKAATERTPHVDTAVALEEAA